MYKRQLAGRVHHFLYRNVAHSMKRLVHSPGLVQLDDGSCIRAHNRLDVEGCGKKSLKARQTPVLAECIQDVYKRQAQKRSRLLRTYQLLKSSTNSWRDLAAS